MAKVLIVGGAGYVGGYVTDLLKSNHDVRVYDDLLYEDTYLKEVEFIRGNILNTKNVLPHLRWADTVVWLAAFVGDPACAVNPGVALDVNFSSLNQVIRLFDGKIIFPSTCSIYGAQEGLLTEDSPSNPLSIYASSKSLAEQSLMERGNSLIFRLGTLFGVSDNFARLRVDLVVNVLTIRAKLEGVIRVFGGEQYRPLLHVRDVGHALENHIESDKTGIFNLHCENLTIKQIAEKVLSEVPNTRIEFTDTSFQDARNYRVSSDKAKNELGFAPRHSVDFGIREISQLVSSGRVTNFANPRFTNVEIIRIRNGKND